jgi:hypothetical protein
VLAILITGTLMITDHTYSDQSVVLYRVNETLIEGSIDNVDQDTFDLAIRSLINSCPISASSVDIRLGHQFRAIITGCFYESRKVEFKLYRPLTESKE